MNDSNPNKKHRDAGSGKYVSEEFADANPTTTVSESTGGQPYCSDELKELLMRLQIHGGAILRSEDLSSADIEKAISDGQYAMGFVYVNIEE
jgi:hypothetical protein